MRWRTCLSHPPNDSQFTRAHFCVKQPKHETFGCPGLPVGVRFSLNEMVDRIQYRDVEIGNASAPPDIGYPCQGGLGQNRIGREQYTNRNQNVIPPLPRCLRIHCQHQPTPQIQPPLPVFDMPGETVHEEESGDRPSRDSSAPTHPPMLPPSGAAVKLG